MASAAQLWFPPEFDPYPKTFGANATVEIGGTISFKNDCAEGINDRFAAFADVYIVPIGSVSNGSTLKDVSAFDTVGPAAGGGFFESVIGFTKPSGAIPGGTYDIVYDECQDGKFDLFDSVFTPALIVDVPVAAVPDITGSIQAAKNAAGLEALPWLALLVTVEAVEIMQKTKAVMECLKAGGIAGCAVAFLVNKLQDYVKEQFYKAFMTTDPNEAAKIYVQNHIKKYAAIFLDPPDASFLTPSVVLLPPALYSSSGDPLQAAQVAVGNAAGTEAALADAFLHAIERYQGADAASEGDAALMQARAVQEYAFLLREQTARTSASLDDLVAAYAADTRPFEDVAPELEELRAQLEADGFSDDQRRLLLNLGASEADITALAEDIANDSYAGFSEAALADQVASIKNANNQVAAGLADTVTGMSSIIAALVADPVTLADAPIADAAGPYSGAAGTAIALDGSGSAVYPGRTVASYAWDLDGDGAFDDASGVAPNATFATGGQRVVGLRVTDSDGKTGIAYASVAVTATNAPPVISLSSPVLDDLELDVGDSMAFSVSATDSDGDALTIRWLVNGVEAATGPSFTYSAATAGMRIVSAQVSDGKPDGLAEREWGVSVLAPDADSDGWNANVDCADGDAEVHPDHREVVGNAKDDDCDASTPDTGSPPVAKFSQAVSPGLVVAFTDESTDANEDIVEWSWNFGDGSTSAAQNPSHTYTVKGLKTITLTVKDATNFTHTVTRGIVVASAPVASFTYLPPSPVGGSEVEFTDTSTDSDGTIASWAWTFGDGGTSAEQNPAHIYLGPGTFDVTLTVTDDDGSTGSVTQSVVIGTADPATAPVALFRPDVPGKDIAALANGGTVVSDSGACCGGHEAYQMLDDNVGLPWATNGVVGKFATIQVGATPRLIDQVQMQPRSDCCPDQRVRNFGIDVSTTGFAPTDFTQVLNATTADSGTLQTFALPAGTTAKYVRYRPLTNNGSCCYLSTSKFKVITSSSGPRTVTFENQSTNAATYKWTFGDGTPASTAASPTHTYAIVGAYTVTLVAKAADGRTSTVSRQYEARGPTADFSVDPAVPAPGEPAVLTDTTLTPSAPLVSFAWNFGDGTTSTSSGTLHTFASAGTYTVSYMVTDAEGNADTVTKEITVAEPAPDALPKARFSPSSGGTNVAFSGAGATIHSFSSQYSASYPPATILDEEPSNTYWATANTVRNGWVKIDLSGDLQDVDRIRIAGDGGTERVKDFRVSVSNTTADDAAFTEVLAASNPNDDTLREYVFPGGAVTARYVRVELLNNWGHTCCVAIDRLDVLTGPASSTGRNLALAEDGASIAAFSGSYDATNYPPTRLIDGDPSTLPWLTPNGVMPGWVKITLSNSAPRMIDRIRLQPRQGGQKVKDFQVAVSTTGTADTDFVTVLSATAADNENLQTFLLPHPMPAKHLLYRVLTNRANGNYSGTGDIRVDTGQESRSTTVRFRNLSRNATSYAWDFGDGATSTDANPVHTYAAAGTYTVTLTATNANGSATFTLEQVVRTAAISYSPATPEAQQQIDFLDATPAELGLTSWTWNFGDGSTSTFRHPVKTYASPGTYTVTLTGTDREGVQHVATADVEVAVPAFRAQFHPRGTFNMASLENGAAVVAFSSQYFDVANWGAPKLLDAYTNTAWHSSTSPAQNTKWIKFGLAGGQTYQIDRFQLLGRQDCCFDQHPADFEIAVSTTGTADADFKTVLRATLPASQTTLQTFMLPRPVLAKYVLYRTLTNRGAGVVTTAMLRAASGQVSTPTVTFDDLTVGGDAPLTYAWDFGDGGTSDLASPTHTFPGPGVYPVTLTVTDGTSATSTYSLQQRIVAAPVVAFTNNPAVPNEAQSTSFTDTTPSPPDGPIVQRTWSWGDGTAATTVNGAGTTHTFADNGSYDVRLDALDAWGQTASTTRSISVANVAPTVEAGPSWRWREDRVLTATTTVADVAGARDPVTCSWTYGDGSAAGTGCPFSHTYANTGTFTATLTANDGDGGITTDTFEVEVIEQEVTGGGGGGGSGSGGGTGVGQNSKDYVYTVDGDFELGTLLNVNHDAPGTDQLQLNKQAKPFPFVYIANSGRGTAVRIDVDTGTILGEYMTAPVNRSRDPSRTTVDKLGNVWVTNRAESETRTIDGLNTQWGSTTRIGLIVGGVRSNADGTPNAAGEYLKAPFEYNTCVDKNSDGLIRTSRGLANILAWPNTSGVDHDGGVETAVDECIQFYVRVRGTGTRTVAIDADNDAWIGGTNSWHEEVDGETGERVPGTAFNLGCGGYGGLIDGNGILWSARFGSGLLRYNTITKTGVCLGNGHGDYGLGVDPVTGHIWHTNLSGNRVVKLNPAATTAATLEIARYPHGNENAQGVAVDSKANVWVSHALFGAPTIGRVRTDGVFLGTPSLGPGASGSTGVAVDANGKVWSANYGTSNASRIDPEIGQKIAGTVPSGWYDMIVNLGSGASPYNYSDMTGAVAVGAASPSGFWSIKQDGTALGTVWKRISWDGSTPGGTTITVEVRAADTQAELPSTPFVTATDGSALSGVVGRFIEVRATLQTNDPTTTPILTDIRISANTPPVASGATAETNKDEARQITLAATDDDGDTLTYEIVNDPLHGTVTLAGNVATYTPASGYTGPDSFTFKARDASGESNVATVTLNVIATNEPPVANDLAVSTPEDVPLGVTLPATDPDGDLLTLTYVQPANGSYDGTLYTPNANYFGPDSFIYTATDPDGESDTGTVSITVTPVNDGPTADDDGYAIDEDTTLSIPAPGILANDDDVDGDTLSTTLEALPSNGTLTYGNDGSFTYQPNLNFSGSDSFTYRAGDGLATSAVATVSISVRPVNDAPTAAGDGYTVDEDTTLTIPAPGILANDGDVDGDALSTTLETLPVHGTLTYGTDGSFMYQPDANYFGLDSFTYRASDGLASSDVAAVSITVRPVNDAPVANDQSIATDEDTSLSITLGADDVDNDSLTYALATAPQHGTWDGTTYTPALNYNGPDSFDFLVSDGNGLSDTGTITITVRPVNDAPNVENRTVETAEDTPLPIDLVGSDVDDATPTITTTQPSNGSYAGGIYTPDANYSGADSFQYTATDAAGLSDTATVTITVRPVNDAPNVGDRALETDEDTPLPIALAGDDIDGDTLTITTTSPSHGTYAGGVYTPAPNYHGPDSFQYTANDGNGGTDTATVTITVRPVNDAPVAGDQSVATNEDTPLAIMLGATDVDGDGLTYALATAPLHGSWDGSTYTPAPNYSGPDSFDFLASDGNGGTDTGTISITVRPVNDAPNVGDRSLATDEDTPLPINLAGTDIDGDTLAITTTAPSHGSYAGGVYTPDTNYHGPDSFEYTANDGNGGSDTATVSITVRPVNDAPNVDDRALETDEDTPLPIALGGSDVDGDALTITTTAPSHGTYAGGVYTPAPNYHGPDSFQYTANDGNGGTDTATVSIVVRPVNEAPVVRLVAPAATDEASAPITLEAIASDPDGDAALTYSWSAGTGTVTPSGSTASYVNDDGPRVDTVTVTVTDGSLSSPASVEIQIRNVAPTANAGADKTSFWGLPLVFAGTATDPSNADTAAGFIGSWSFADGTLPVAGMSVGHSYSQPGSYTATLTASDKDGGSDTDEAAVTITKRTTALGYTGPTTGTGAPQTLTARLTDTVDLPSADLAGKTIVFSIGSTTVSGVTDAGGVASATATLPSAGGTLTVSFAGDTRYLGSNTSAAIGAAGGAGKVTGGGLRASGSNGRGGFNVQSTADGVKGELQWQKTGLNFHAHELSSLLVSPDGRTAWFTGVGIDGRAFTAYVEDNGEPGRTDVFMLWIGGRLQSAPNGTLIGGNIQIHK